MFGENVELWRTNKRIPPFGKCGYIQTFQSSDSVSEATVILSLRRWLYCHSGDPPIQLFSSETKKELYDKSHLQDVFHMSSTHCF